MMMNTAVTKGAGIMDIKKVSISAKRQITIPQKFFTLLGFDDEAECVVRGNELVIRPVRNNSGGEFAEQILADLIAEGLSGDELLKKFKETQKKVRPAVEEMLDDASKATMSDSGFETYNDVFGSEG
jgi:bifunctional DNA-binding transcriptional regulator/antitoxin component of YhaV-PrlF toxin-antitoxin module